MLPHVEMLSVALGADASKEKLIYEAELCQDIKDDV